MLLKYNLMAQTKRKLEKRLILKYNYSSGKMKPNMQVVLLKGSLMQEKVVVTKICFYGKTK